MQGNSSLFSTVKRAQVPLPTTGSLWDECSTVHLLIFVTFSRATLIDKWPGKEAERQGAGFRDAD